MAIESTTQHILDKLSETHNLSMRRAKFGEADGLNKAMTILICRVAEEGPGFTPDSLRAVTRHLREKARSSGFYESVQGGLTTAADLIDQIAETYGVYEATDEEEAPSVLPEPVIPAPIGEIVSLDTDPRAERERIQGFLQAAELELLAWASGNRSSNNEQLNAEASPEDRGETLVRIAQQDAAELELAIRKVEALRLLLAGLPTS